MFLLASARAGFASASRHTPVDLSVCLLNRPSVCLPYQPYNRAIRFRSPSDCRYWLSCRLGLTASSSMPFPSAVCDRLRPATVPCRHNHRILYFLVSVRFQAGSVPALGDKIRPLTTILQLIKPREEFLLFSDRSH